MAFRKITTPSLKEAFVQEMEKMILSGELKIGDKLPPERELVETLGISLSVITAGIADLENKGFVEIRPRHGVFVSDYIHKGSLDTLMSIMRYNDGKLGNREVISFTETRIVLEQLMVEQVIERAEEKDIKALGQYFDRMRESQSIEDAANLIQDFIHELSILSGNMLLPLLYHAFRSASYGMVVRSMKKNGIDKVCAANHVLYNKVLDRDTEGAKEWAERYLMMNITGETSILD